MSASARVIRLVLLLPLALTAMAAGGCDDDELRYRYRAHTDKITRGAGDASASNIAAQTIDPWPPHSRRTQIDLNGRRAYIAIKRYETNTSIPPKGVNTTNGFNGNGGYLASPPNGKD